MFRNCFAVLLLIGLGTGIWNTGAFAQVPRGFAEISNTTSLRNTLAGAAKATQTIASDFNQVKHMKMMNDKVTSKGKFYFKKEDRIRIEYTSPFQYLLVMSGGQIMVRDGGKTNKINTRNSKAMQSVNRVMMDCMTGAVFNNKDFSVKAYDSKGQYLMELTPLNSSMKSLFARIDVFIDKTDNSVAKLVMNEAGGDYTEMLFTNKKINTALADALFSLR